MLGWQTRGKKSKYTFEGILENLVDVFDRVHLCDSCKRVERIVFACSPYKILRHVSPSTTESSANVTSPLPAASVWLRLWPFCTVNLKFQGRFEQLVFIAGVKTFRQVSSKSCRFSISIERFLFSCNNARRKLSRIFENVCISTIYESCEIRELKIR